MPTSDLIAGPSPASSHCDFRSEVPGGWAAVHPAVRARMDRLLTADEPTTFIGTGFAHRSRAGWIFAQLCRLAGAPLVWRQGDRVTTTVTVAPTQNGLRCWHRTFRFEDGSTQVVRTTKVVDSRLGLLDAVGARGEKPLAMRMKVWAEGSSLFFKSDGYYLRIAGFAFPIPRFLTPGEFLAEHRDLGDGTFIYTLRFHHPLWGETFTQEGRFRLVD